GGAGRDTMGLDRGDDLVSGGADRDLIEAFAKRSSPLVVNLAAGKAFGLGLDRVLGVEDVSFVRQAHVTIIGTDDPNAITVFAAPVTIRGRGGNDTLRGWDFDDRLHGGRGDDNITGFSGDDLLDGGAGTDTLD